MPVAENGPQPQPRVRLAEARLSRGWSQQEVAHQIGTTYVNVSRWERGVTKPTPYFRRKLSHLFGKTEQELGLERTRAEDTSYKTDENQQQERQEQLATASGSLPTLIPEPVYDPAIPLKPPLRLVGRNQELFLLKQQLFAGDNVALSALNGLPGVGKTALSIALAHDPQVREYFRDGILWAASGTRTGHPRFVEPLGNAARPFRDRDSLNGEQRGMGKGTTYGDRLAHHAAGD